MKFTKFLEIPGNLMKFKGICGISALSAKKRDPGRNGPKYH